jgi:hypothetical protein
MDPMPSEDTLFVQRATGGGVLMKGRLAVVGLITMGLSCVKGKPHYT